MNSDSRTWLLRFPYILYMAMTTVGAPPSPAREHAFKTALTAMESNDGFSGALLREARQQNEAGRLMQGFLTELRQGKTNLAQGILTCIDVINHDLQEQEGDSIRKMAFELAAAIAQHATPANKEKDLQFIKNLQVWLAMM